jgi:hypothetical protein
LETDIGGSFMKTTETQLAKDIIRILKVKANRGCNHQSWEGFQNGNGEDVGKDIDRLIRKAEKVLNAK